MEERADSRVAFLHMRGLAALSVFMLGGIIVWQIGQAVAQGRMMSVMNPAASLSERAETPYGNVDWQASLAAAKESEKLLAEIGAPDPEGLSNIGENVVGALVDSYASLSETGSYTPEQGEKVAEDIAESLHAQVSYKIYTASDVKTDPDASYERMLAYRNDLRIALEPLLKNPGYELSLFANYIGSNDVKYLQELRKTAQNYRDAVERSAGVVVPLDAASYHVGVLNALSEFGATVDRLAEFADDAFAAAALLRTYNNSEANLLTSFNSLAGYYKSKTP
jgi:hypothetical protein